MNIICINCGKSVLSKFAFYFGFRWFCDDTCAKDYYQFSNKGFNKKSFKEAIKQFRTMMKRRFIRIVC